MKSIILSKADAHGFREVRLDGARAALGSIGKVSKGGWISILLHYRNLPFSFHRLANDAAQALW